MYPKYTNMYQNCTKRLLKYKFPNPPIVSDSIGLGWRRRWQPTPGFLPGNVYGLRSLAGYSPWDCTELNMTEQLNMGCSSSIYVSIKSPGDADAAGLRNTL